MQRHFVSDAHADEADTDIAEAVTTASTSPRNVPRVLMIITGGTICMRPGAQEGSTMSKLAPAPLETFLRDQPELQHDSLPEFDIHEWETLVDSSDISIEHWRRLALDIQENYDKYSGFVILHGTDTLAYTSSMLAFMLEDLTKPVVVTGAVLPISHMYSDAKRNVCTSLMVAGFSTVQEVIVCFGSRVLRGSRASKVDCSNMDAFDSPNNRPLGTIGLDLTIEGDLLSTTRTACVSCSEGSGYEGLEAKRFVPFTDVAANSVFVLTITPGFDPILLRHLTALETRPLGVILQLFGTGTAPIANRRLSAAIKFAIDSGVTVLAVTQCRRGRCSLVTYSNGNALHDMGLIEGKDLTTEAAFAKLAYLLGKGYEGSSLREMIEKNLRGELSENVVKVSGQMGLRKWLPVAENSLKASAPAPASCT